MTVDGADHRINNHPTFGGAKEWKMLPAGEYKIKAQRRRASEMDYTMNINVHAETQAATLSLF